MAPGLGPLLVHAHATTYAGHHPHCHRGNAFLYAFGVGAGPAGIPWIPKLDFHQHFAIPARGELDLELSLVHLVSDPTMDHAPGWHGSFCDAVTGHLHAGNLRACLADRPLLLPPPGRRAVWPGPDQCPACHVPGNQPCRPSLLNRFMVEQTRKTPGCARFPRDHPRKYLHAIDSTPPLHHLSFRRHWKDAWQRVVGWQCFMAGPGQP